MSLRLLVFLGSTREGRMGENVAKCVINMLREKEHQADLVDPLIMQDGHIHQPLHFMKNQAEAPEWMKTTHASIQAASGFVIVTPEYNSTLPPALTSIMDHFPPASYRHKPCAIVTYSMGSFGGIRSAAAARPFLAELGLVSLPSVCVIPQVVGKFDSEGVCTDDRIQKNLAKVVSEIQWYAEAMEEKKKVCGVPS
ncbi:NADPH azoreductase-like [Penaeus monodon]|uniref:NADPH azoreductase-like n=1 Tax=Penaeus monodon TaxID=6687 RepID=UPI0018A72B92|nr:NADPH azoreductase-like [Penaeus monodon]